MTAIASIRRVPINIETGTNEDLQIVISYVDADDTPIDLGGIAFALQGRRARETNEASFAASSAAGTITVGGDGNGTLYVSVPVAAMRRVPAGQYVVDIVATADGLARRAADGVVTVVRGVTR